MGSGPQVLHVRQVGVGVTQGMGGPEFVMAAWGAPAFPGGGQWSVVEINGPTVAPTALTSGTGVPLIRAGAAGTTPLPSSPYRFADPADLYQPANPGRDYALLHAMGTQRALYPRLMIDAADPTRITSTQRGTVADPYSLGTATGPYPAPDNTVPFPTAAWALAVSADGNYKLDLPSPFAAGVGRRTLQQAGSVRGDVDYTAAEVTYAVDTSQAVGWQFRVDNLTKTMNTTALGDVVSLTANIVGSELAVTQFEEPQVLLGGALSIVQDLLTFLADLGITGVMTTQMTNDWAFKAPSRSRSSTRRATRCRFPRARCRPGLQARRHRGPGGVGRGAARGRCLVHHRRPADVGALVRRCSSSRSSCRPRTAPSTDCCLASATGGTSRKVRSTSKAWLPSPSPA